MPAWTPDLRAHLDTLAHAAGFALAGIAPAADPEHAAAARFTAWVDSGHAAGMDYLKRRAEDGTLVRAAVHTPLPWARSVIVCAFNANAPGPRSIDPAPPAAAWIARYAWPGKPHHDQQPGRPDSRRSEAAPEAPGPPLAPSDYHDDLLARLRSVEAALLARAPCRTRCYVDTGPLLERDLAARAGLGWIGRNTCALHQRIGSWFLLGVIVTSLDLPLPLTPQLAPDRCGSCTRCIDACPTGALLPSTAPGATRQMDAARCIAYLTIEHKGPIPEPLRAPIGRHVFGCDICQEVCPWNTRAPIAAALPTRPELVNPALAWLAGLTPADFKRHFKRSSLERTGLKRLRRNIAIAIGNAGDPALLPQLQAWAADAEADPVLAEAVQWAIRRLAPPAPGSEHTVPAPSAGPAC